MVPTSRGVVTAIGAGRGGQAGVAGWCDAGRGHAAGFGGLDSGGGARDRDRVAGPGAGFVRAVRKISGAGLPWAKSGPETPASR